MQPGNRVQIGEVQFCVEFRGNVGTVTKVYHRGGQGMLADVRLDAPVRVRTSGTAHWNIRGVPIDDLLPA